MRAPAFDILKGLGIILVLVGHAGIPCGLSDFIYSFHMPLFFVISGYFAKSLNETKNSHLLLIRKDCKRLLVPYIITSAAIILFTLLRSVMKHDVSIVKDMFMNFAEVTYDAVPIWFFIALLWIRIVFRPLMNLRRWALPMSIVLSGIAILFAHHCMQLPFCILTSIAAIPFYAIGWWHRQYGFPKWLTAISAVCWLGVLYGPRVDLYNVLYGIFPLTILGSSGATWLLYKLIRFIIRNKEGNAFPILRWLGVNSLIIMCFHAFDLYCSWFTMLSQGVCGVQLSYWPTQIIRDVFVFLFSWIHVTYLRPKFFKNEKS